MCGKTKITNETYGLYILLTIILKNDNLKYTAIFQRKLFTSFSIFHIFLSFFIISLKILGKKKYHIYDLYFISYTLSFIYLMYYIVSEILIGECFLEDCLYCYYQQVISAVAKESLSFFNFLYPQNL